MRGSKRATDGLIVLSVHFVMTLSPYCRIRKVKGGRLRGYEVVEVVEMEIHNSCYNKVLSRDGPQLKIIRGRKVTPPRQRDPGAES
jgi:hypothetical protein